MLIASMGGKQEAETADDGPEQGSKTLHTLTTLVIDEPITLGEVLAIGKKDVGVVDAGQGSINLVVGKQGCQHDQQQATKQPVTGLGDRSCRARGCRSGSHARI